MFLNALEVKGPVSCSSEFAQIIVVCQISKIIFGALSICYYLKYFDSNIGLFSIDANKVITLPTSTLVALNLFAYFLYFIGSELLFCIANRYSFSSPFFKFLMAIAFFDITSKNVKER